MSDFLVGEINFQSMVNTVPSDTVTNENRFGVSLMHGLDFVKAYKNQTINGYKVSAKYDLFWKDASVNAETFLWNIHEYKVTQ